MKNKINWKDKLDDLNITIGQINMGAIEGDIREEIIKFTELACIEQKKICNKEALVSLFEQTIDGNFIIKERDRQINSDSVGQVDFSVSIDEHSILNAPTVKFE